MYSGVCFYAHTNGQDRWLKGNKANSIPTPILQYKYQNFLLKWSDKFRNSEYEMNQL
jgi:hypothetical protein